MANGSSKPITEKQKDFILSLLKDRDLSTLPEDQRSFLADISNLDLLNTKQASSAIEALLSLPKLPTQPTFAKDEGKSPQYESGLVPEGYFFIVDPTEDDPTKVEKFFRVRHGKPNTRWEGYAFLDVQASDFFYPIKDRERREKIFAEIAKDPTTAMNEYGLRLGRCGVCNRTLTDRHSILRGIGPICAGKLAPTVEQISMIEMIQKKYEKGGE